MSALKLANRYAKSILDLSIERGILEEVYSDVQGLQKLTKSSRDFYLMLKSPIVKSDIKLQVMQQAFEGKINAVTLKFIKIVIGKKREGYLPEIFEAFTEQYNDVKEITPVLLTTAVEVDDNLKNRIVNLVKEKYGKKNVLLTARTNKEIKGGFIVEFDNMQYDASLSHKIEALRKEFFKNPAIKN